MTEVVEIKLEKEVEKEKEDWKDSLDPVQYGARANYHVAPEQIQMFSEMVCKKETTIRNMLDEFETWGEANSAFDNPELFDRALEHQNWPLLVYLLDLRIPPEHFLVKLLCHPSAPLELVQDFIYATYNYEDNECPWCELGMPRSNCEHSFDWNAYIAPELEGSYLRTHALDDLFACRKQFTDPEGFKSRVKLVCDFLGMACENILNNL